jgi:hypothetical protein
MFWTQSSSSANDNRVAATDSARVIRGSQSSYNESGSTNFQNAHISTPTTINVRDSSNVTLGGDPNLGAQFAATTQTLSDNFANTVASIQQSATNALAAVLAGSASPTQVAPPVVDNGRQPAPAGNLSWTVVLAGLAAIAVLAWLFIRRK